MPHTRHLDWPFFDPPHRALAHELEAWAAQQLSHTHGSDVDAECRTLVRSLGAGGWLRHAVGGRTWGGAAETIWANSVISSITHLRMTGKSDDANSSRSKVQGS